MKSRAAELSEAFDRAYVIMRRFIEKDGDKVKPRIRRLSGVWYCVGGGAVPVKLPFNWHASWGDAMRTLKYLYRIGAIEMFR